MHGVSRSELLNCAQAFVSGSKLGLDTIAELTSASSGRPRPGVGVGLSVGVGRLPNEKAVGNGKATPSTLRRLRLREEFREESFLPQLKKVPTRDTIQI